MPLEPGHDSDEVQLTAGTTSRASRSWLVPMSLVLVAAVAYVPLLYNDFIDFDDPDYITSNPHVTAGLTRRGIAWAWTTFRSGNYHPLTWMSLQLDATLFSRRSPGQEPHLHAIGFHLDSFCCHAASSVLLFFVIRRLTGAEGASGVVAALFAVHPLHVESVAWAAERKDVLCTFFWVLSLAAYLRYVDTGRLLWYAALLVACALGLLAKPMLVTLPCVLLLLDVWPLRRVRWHTGPSLADGLRHQRSPLALVVEKLPLFALVAASSVLTMMAQRLGQAVLTLQALSLTDRLVNAVAAYGWYLQKTVWPSDLALYYPHPRDQWTWPPVLGGMGLLLAGTGFALAVFRRVPALLVGWLWFLGTLVPVIGIVQVGGQSRADRYCYLPHIGLFLALVWAAWALLQRLRIPAAAQVGLAGAAILALAGSTFAQVRYWKNAETVWQHTLDVTSNNDLAHCNMGLQCMLQGRWADARRHFQAAVDLQPNDAIFLFNLGGTLLIQGEFDLAATNFENSLLHYGDFELQQAMHFPPDYYLTAFYLGTSRLRQGQLDHASDAFHRALEKEPAGTRALAGLGLTLWQQGQHDLATEKFRQALSLNPAEAEALYGLGLVRLRQQKEREAAELLAAAVQAQPSLSEAHSELGVVRRRLGHWQEAADNQQRAIQLETNRLADMTRPNFIRLALYRRRLAFALTMLGQPNAAAREYSEALRLEPAWPQKDTKEAWRMATAANPCDRDVPTAWELASMACQAVPNPPAESLDALAAACAAAGWFEAATSAARKALAQAPPAQRTEIAKRLQKYAAGQPYVSAHDQFRKAD